jgi:penicillin-binding protein 1A
MGEFYAERRIEVPYSRLPRHLILAFVAAEDARFFEHPGVDMFGIVRAFLRNVEAGEMVQGGAPSPSRW